MPFDGLPQDYETKPDVFSPQGLLAWLETQDTATEYDYLELFDCLLCKYGRANGLRVSSAGAYYIRTADGVMHPVFPEDSNIASAEPYTYGAAAKRLRSLLSTAG